MKTVRLTILCSLILSLPSYAQKENKYIRSGNDLFAAGQYEQAEEAYHDASQIAPDSYKANFNLGSAQYKQENYDEAINNFRIVAKTQTDKKRVANAHYNIGNALLSQQKYDEAIESYKESLRNAPSDTDAKYNLAYARKMKEQSQNKDDKDQDKKDDKKDQDKKDEDKKDDKDQDKKDDKKDNKDKKDDQQNKDKDGKDKNEKPDENQKQDEEQQKPRISKENAARMLDAMNNDEKQTLERVKQEQAKTKKVRVEKDW